MSAVSLLTPILNGGIQNVNFVNGRVLTAEDMTAERAANLQRQRLMGTSIGDGVACGLEVTLSSSSVAYGQQVVHVTAGLAVNRNGDMLQLPTGTDVTLTATLPAAAAGGALFAPCQPPQTQLTNPGIYVLTVMPASGYQGSVPVTQLNSSGVATSCSSRYRTAGVQFRLSLITLASTGTGLQPTLYALGNQIQTNLNNNASAASQAASLSQFRNGLAYACYGTQTLATYAANPFAGLPQSSTVDLYGLIDDQRTAGLITNCEVPLALAYWSQQGIQFVDMWSVRRSPTPPSAASNWSPELSQRRSIEAFSAFLQFQAQIDDLCAELAQNTLSTAKATDYFLFLPPAGVIPLSGFGPNGLDPVQFFSGRQTRGPFFIEGVNFEALLRRSLSSTSIDLATDQQMMWLYVIRENMQAVSSSVVAAPTPAMVFTTGYMPYFAEPQFDLSHWNNANFALTSVPAR
jgi:hypothetical protein